MALSILPKSVYATWARIPDGTVAVSLPPDVSTPSTEIYYQGVWYLQTSGVAVTVSGGGSSGSTPPQLAGLSVSVVEENGQEVIKLNYGSKTIHTYSD